MTTNGLVLSEKLDSLIDAGLTSVNISLGMCTCTVCIHGSACTLYGTVLLIYVYITVLIE